CQNGIVNRILDSADLITPDLLHISDKTRFEPLDARDPICVVRVSLVFAGQSTRDEYRVEFVVLFSVEKILPRKNNVCFIRWFLRLPINHEPKPKDRSNNQSQNKSNELHVTP